MAVKKPAVVTKPNQQQQAWYNQYSANVQAGKGQTAARDQYAQTLANKYGLKPVVTKPTAPKPTVKPGFDQNAYMKGMQDKVNSMYDAQKQAQLQSFYNQRDRAVGQINQQKAELLPAYANKRNQADVVSNQNMAALKEQMAAQGLQGSGENVTASVGANNARLGALAQLNLQQQQETNDFDRRIADLNDPGEEQAITSAIDAQRMQALYDAQIRADETGYNRGRDALMDTRYADETKYSRGQDALNRHDSNYWNRANQNNITRDYNRQVLESDRSWNNVSPADAKLMQLQLQKSLALKKASGGGGGGGRRSSSRRSSSSSSSNKNTNKPTTSAEKTYSKGYTPPVAPQDFDSYAQKMARIMEPEMYQKWLVEQEKKRREEIAKSKK